MNKDTMIKMDQIKDEAQKKVSHKEGEQKTQKSIEEYRNDVNTNNFHHVQGRRV